jgi:type IV pilus assembly protein PilA
MQRPRQRGFTLIEVMTVVVIVGVLATLAVYGVRKYVFAAKTSEAIHMIGLIKTAQESYKDETFTYLDISADLGDLYPNPKADLINRNKRMWNFGSPEDKWSLWRQLGVQADSPLQFGYSCVAGGAGATLPQPDEIATPYAYGSVSPATGPWYVVQAMADQDGDGVRSLYVSNSFQNEIYSEREDE